MNIKHENVPGLIQEVTIEINKEDYAEALEKALKKQRRTANVPGFRVGCAPMGMIKRMYEKQLMVQEVDMLVNKSMDDFMKEGNVKYIFEPLPVEEKSVVNFETPDHFEFVYEYALAPAVEIDYKKLPKVVDFEIVATEDECKKYVDTLRERHGQYSTPETIGEKDSISVKYMVGEEEKNAFFFAYELKDEAQKAFLGKKVDDVVEYAMKDAFVSQMSLEKFLKLPNNQQLEEGNDYKFAMTIRHIGRIEMAELNEEFFKKAFPDGRIADEKALNEEAAKVVVEQYKTELDRQFANDAIETLVSNVEMELPDAFIKRYITLTQKDMTVDMVEEKYSDYQRAFKWQILEEKVLEGSDVKISMDDVKEYFRQYFIKNYFGNFNMDDVKDRVEEMVNQAAANKEYVKSVYDMLFDEKLTAILRSKMNIEKRSGDVKAFVEMLTERQKEIAGEKPAKKSPAKKKAAEKKDGEEGAAAEEEPKAKKPRAKTAKKSTEETK